MNETAHYQSMLDAVVNGAAAYPEGRFQGRGVVYCGGGDLHFPCAWVSICMLRRMGCRLPVELWYRGRREMTPAMVALLEPLGVVCVDAYEVARRHPFRRLDGWELKPFAIAHSGFREVLYIDADNMAARDPGFLFEDAEYDRVGAVFWPDRYAGPGTGHEWLKREAWELCRVPHRVEPEIEAGQLLIDKTRCWLPLQLALHLNEHSDFYYQYFYGDKDTFHLAWRRAGPEYTLVPYAPRNLGDSEVIVQAYFDGQTMFQHRNRAKWSLTRPNPRIPGFRFEAECLECLEELRQCWRPPVRQWPAEFTECERLAYEAIGKARYFEYALEGVGERMIELLLDFRIGRGSAPMESAWMIEEDKDGAAVLTIRNENGPICFLRRDSGDAWRGRWLVYDRMRVMVRPWKV